MHNLFPPPLPKHKNASSPKPSFLRTNNMKTQHQPRQQQDLSVSNLRKLYSSLLEEMAPRHAEMGTGRTCTNSNSKISNIRWKNAGTITISGDDDEGYDYAYTPDDTKKSWRLRNNDIGGSMNGVTGGDWSKDGVRRYYTGGAVVRGEAANKEGGEILSIGSMEVDISTMNGVGISPKSSPAKNDGVREKDGELFDDVNAPSLLDDVVDAMEEVDIADSPSESMEDVALGSPGANEDESGSTKGDFNKTNMFDSDNRPSMTTFESLFHISPTIAWRLRSAYAPKTAQEHDLVLLGSEALSHRQPEKAEGIAKGLELAKNSEIRVCDGVWKVGELICLCEKMKNRDAQDDSSGDGDDIEAAEAVFAYMCEKNILPMLIDAVLCRPPPLFSTSTFDSSTSPFSGATWTASVKAQILQVLAMLLFNTTSALSLTYLLSNNYMNELIMGILPLDQWKEEALEEILPPYVTLLRGLVTKLRGDEGKYCVPLLLCQRQSRNSNDQEAYFPLLFAAVQVLVSNAGSTLRDGDGCLIKTTVMNVVLNLCRVVDADVRDVLVGGLDTDDTDLPTTKSKAAARPTNPLSAHLTIEQELIFTYICSSIKVCYDRSVRLLMATLQLNQTSDPNKNREAREEASARHKDIASSLLSELRHWFGFIDDLLSCEIRSWNVRLCEYIMSDVIVGTVLLNWNRSLALLEESDVSLKLSEEIKATAETRTSVNFITQFLSMVEFRPLVKMVVAALLAEKYPVSWHRKPVKGNEFFAVTPILQRMASGGKVKTREEADAGAGGGSSKAKAQDETNTVRGPNSQQTDRRKSPQESEREMGNRALETAAAKLNLVELADKVESHHNQTSEIAYEPNHHRRSLLDMLSGKTEQVEVALASMLIAAILENDAIDDGVLETLGVLPSSEPSSFECAIAECLDTHISNASFDPQAQFGGDMATAVKYVSSLGIMLLERIIYHTWTEDGTCLDEAPFNLYYSSSRFVQALQTSLHSIARYALKLSTNEVTKDLFADRMEIEIVKRYRRTDPESPRQHNAPRTTFTCCLSSYNPSNFIEDSTPAASPHDTPYNNIEALKFASDLVLHLRSLLMCVQEFHHRFTSLAGPRSIANKRWCDEDDALSFRMIDSADDSILAIGGFQVIPLPQIGTEIDLRGRTVFHGFEHKKKLSIVDASVMALVLVIDPDEVYVGRKVRTIDKNRCVVDEVIPIRDVIASAAEKTLLHMALKSSGDLKTTGAISKGGKLTIDFRTSDKSIAVKDCLDKYCVAYRTKKSFEIEDFLENCGQLTATKSQDIGSTNDF